MVSDQEILNYIKSQQEVSIPELQKRFSAGYPDIVKIIRQLLEEGAISLDSGVRYSVLKRGEADANADEDEDGDEDDALAQRRAFLEARRREIMRRMREELESDDDDDDDDDLDVKPLADTADDEEDSDDETPHEVHAIFQALDEGVAAIQSEGESYLVPKGLEICGGMIRFMILVRDDGVYLSDNGLALRSLQERVSLEEEGIGEQISMITERYNIVVVGEELRIEIEAPERAISCMMLLFAAIERIVTIDEEEIVVCVDRGKEDGKIWEAAKELLVADPDMDRGELILHMKERYQSVKESGNFDDIVIYARAVKEFGRMTDEDYAKSRDHLLGRENRTEAEEDTVDPLYIKALAIVIREGEASISLVQRRCNIGYNHAGKIIEWMESMGYISPFDRKRGRRVLIRKEQFIKKYGPLE